MYIKRNVIVLLLSLCFIACNNAKEETNQNNSGLNKDTTRKKENKITTLNSDSVINSLQGEWRETEYPFRMAHFRNTTVKFTEEGVVEEPTFKVYKISEDCSFEVNNVKNAKPEDIFLIMVDAQTCDILNVSNDTLTLSGFSVNTNSDYKIVYARVN